MSDAPVVLVFDIDGTLLHSVTDHQAALRDAYRALGVELGQRPLSGFPDHTDSAIFDLLLEEASGQRATAHDFARLDAVLDAAYRARVTGAAPREIAGARQLLRDLDGDARFRVVFATGSMRGVAAQKLVQVGVDPDSAVVVTASDFLTREAIVAHAIELAAAGPHGTVRVISIGDGIWDLRTAAHLGLPFLAVESGTHHFADGPIHTVTDLRSLSPDALLALCAASPAPFPTVHE